MFVIIASAYFFVLFYCNQLDAKQGKTLITNFVW